MNEGKKEEAFEYVSVYSRADAIRDGVLIDVSEMAIKEAGFRYPVALTSRVFESCVAVPDEVSWQSEDARAWDLLWMTRYAISRNCQGQQRIPVLLYVQNDCSEPKLTRLVVHCGAGDLHEPVLTIMFPDED